MNTVRPRILLMVSLLLPGCAAQITTTPAPLTVPAEPASKPAPTASPLEFAPADHSAIVIIRPGTLRNLVDKREMVASGISGRSITPDSSIVRDCGGALAEHVREVVVFSAGDPKRTLRIARVAGPAAELAQCMARAFGSNPAPGNPTAVKDDVAVGVGDLLLAGQRQDVDAAVARLRAAATRSPHPPPEERPELFLFVDHRFASPERGRESRRLSVWIEGNWVKSERVWDFDTEERAGAWLKTRATESAGAEGLVVSCARDGLKVTHAVGHRPR